MKGKLKGLWLGICGAVASLCLIAGVCVSEPTVEALAASESPTVTMVAGASARLKGDEPGIRFTAEIDNYDSSYEYGMLILPESAWEVMGWSSNAQSYHADLAGKTYADQICTPYEKNGDKLISFALRNIELDNYDMNFVGVAYVKSGSTYRYADVEVFDDYTVSNARSIAFVSQMALKYQTGLTAGQKNVLKTYANAFGVTIDSESFTDGSNLGSSGIKGQESNYVMQYTFNAAGETVPFVTKQAYAGGSTVSFKYYLPAGAVTSWWGIAWHTDPSKANIYHAAGAENPVGYQTLGSTTGTWTDVSFTLPAGGPYYLYLGSEVGASKGRWMLNGDNAYAYIEDFKVGSTTENFSADRNDWIFQVNSFAAVSAYEYEKGSSILGTRAQERGAQIFIDQISSDAGSPTFITKQAYTLTETTTITFNYYMTGNTNNKWWTLNWTSDSSYANIYAFVEPKDTNNGVEISHIQDSWQSASVEVPAGTWYFYFGGSVGDWTGGSVIVDNFAIGNQVVENFNEGFGESIFNVNKAGAVVLGEGLAIVEDNTDYMLAFDGAAIGGNEYVAMITDVAYSGVTEINFKAIWTGDAVSARWGLSYTTKPSAFSYGDEVSALNCYSPKLGVFSQAAGVVHTYRLTISGQNWEMLEDGVKIGGGNASSNPYVEGENYFYFVVCPAVTGGMAFYLDDFSITYAGGTVMDTFANGRSEVFVESATKNTSYGSSGMSFEDSIFNGVEEPEGPSAPVEKIGDLAMKYIFNVSGEVVSQVTKKAYAGGSNVSFKYYLPEGTQTKWWGLVWSTSNSGLDIYAAASNASAYPLGTALGAWTNVSFTLPAGGPYYLYFGSEVGNWKLNGGNAYVFIDDFTVGETTENFDGGLANSIFEVLVPGTVVDSADGEGYVAPAPEALGVKILINDISSKGQSFVTSSSYTGVRKVTFDYFMADNTSNKWWSFCWSESNSANNDSTTIYAHTGSYAGCGGVALPTAQGVWQSVTVDVPDGTWYFYIGGAKGEWGNGYVILDNLVFTDVNGNVVVTENFNNGFGIFENRRPANVMLEAGKPDFVPGEYAAKLDFSNSFDNNAKTFITKNTYAGGSTVSFMYMIPEETTVGDWWAICYDTNGSSPNFWAVATGFESDANGGANPNPNKLKGQGWVEYSVTLPAGGSYYLYFTGYQNWSGYVYVDNFAVNGVVVEDFNRDLAESIFTVNAVHVGLSKRGEGYVATEPEVPEVPDDAPVPGDEFAFENQLYFGTILETLENGGYSSMYVNAALDVESVAVPGTMAVLTGVFDYVIDGEKEFAVWFGGNGYLLVSNTKIALYNGVNLIKEVSVDSAANSLRITITKDYRVFVDYGAGNIGFGSMDACNQVKWVALGGNGTVSFSDINIDVYTTENSEVLEDVPTYMTTESIDFTAYNFDSEAMVSENGFKLLADAGFTKTLALQQGRWGGYGDAGNENTPPIPDEETVINLMNEVNRDAEKALTLAEKYGLMHYVLNGGLYNIERETDNYQWVDKLAELATYTMSNAFAGHFLTDEPQSGKWFTDDELGELVNAYKLYKQEFPKGEAFINLLPRDSSQFTSESMYIDYVEEYIETIALDYNGVPGTGYVSFDHYPLHEDGITSTHLRNLEIVANLCRENGLELRTYIKASELGDGGRGIRATESVNDLYMQIYSALAYGSKEIIYYTWTNNEDIGDSVLDGDKPMATQVYNWAKQANNEVLGMSSAYMSFAWKSASVFGKTNLTQFNNLKNKAGAYGYISSVSSSASVLIGNFDDADGKYTYGAKNGYMVVNYGNTDGNTAESSISITFNGTPTRALVYENGMAKVYALNNNVLTLNLQLGEGAFVIPLTANA